MTDDEQLVMKKSTDILVQCENIFSTLLNDESFTLEQRIAIMQLAVKKIFSANTLFASRIKSTSIEQELNESFENIRTILKLTGDKLKNEIH